MSLGEIVWLVLIAIYTIYQMPFATSMPEMLGRLTAGAIMGILPIYIGRRLKKSKSIEEEK